MKLLLLGATGGTGRHLVTQALETGHDVTVLARNRAGVTTLLPRLHVVEGDVATAAGLTEAVRGHDVSN